MTARKEYVRSRTLLYLELASNWNAASKGIHSLLSGTVRFFARAAKLGAAILGFLSAVGELAADRIQPQAQQMQLVEVSRV